MAKSSKRIKEIISKLEPGKVYPVADAVDVLKSLKGAKFNESLDVAIRLGVDAKKSDQNVRGATVLPHGLGKEVKVAVFAQGEQAEAAQQAGADIVGYEDLAEAVKKGELNCDVVIATPDSMRLVGQLGQILGPKGLMPNPKVGTVSKDVATAVKHAKAGQVRYRTDKNGIIHCSIGKIDFENQALIDNLKTLLLELKKIKTECG